MTEIVPLAGRPDLIERLAEALRLEWADWYGVQPREQTVAELAERARLDGIPLGLVAVDGEVLVGTVALNAASIATHTHLTPWLGGLWVDAAHRGRGTGAALVAACRREAARLGYERLYAATASAGSLFRRDGWRRIDAVELPAHPGERIDVFARAP